MSSFSDKVGIVTGAGSGLGEAGAKRLAADGAKIVVADRDSAGAARVAGQITAAGGHATPLTVDIAEAEQAEKLVAFAISTYGRLDFAFNNAGVTPRLVDTHEVDPKDWRDVIDVNLTGTFYCMKAELAHFAEVGAGVILNMASTAGLMAHPGRVAYSASKHGIIGMTRSAAVEYAQRRIRINAIAPGPIDGPSAQALPPEIRAVIAAKTAMNRPGSLQEAVAVAAFLLSDQASFVTGSVYEVNGGQTQL
ncbi:SDR family NAD(P)-dependent oxidoreductase [Catenulispora rubra]|uniref:SDR family NAD(P)-dependent oxidoreductase n=1 Tax=Catenulispora rubra TaxID=280293 RepID=UPI00189271B2|nr:SDR family NAD(P)-dependent oxidoreductase [Catenulispora rubra]